MFDTTKYFPHSVDSEHPSLSEPNEFSSQDNLVTYDMVHKLQGRSTDQIVEMASEADLHTGHDVTSSPQLMIIFEEGDINSALHFLIESAQNPFSSNAVAMVLVQEKIRGEIVDRILPKLHPLSKFVAEHPSYLTALEKCETSNLNIIRARISEVAPPLASPTFVCECTHDVLGSYPTGVITFHTFRNNQEAIAICRGESMAFASVSIWNETLTGCYDLVVAMSSSYFFFNCANVDLFPDLNQLKAQKNYVVIENGYHFETLRIYDNFKSIVFPIGGLILPRIEHRREEQAAISFLEA
ncbi:uncharacterized protein LOC120445314 [Drosophila santomea]|uniref:uncharacterized protein LOC120445314 n=1 Tax=Drosophila santomea TaxID=129105 RepID=UPI001952BC1F|nr:uncharacterized protein LOC120445314 [Drosophila santomea]